MLVVGSELGKLEKFGVAAAQHSTAPMAWKHRSRDYRNEHLHRNIHPVQHHPLQAHAPTPQKQQHDVDEKQLDPLSLFARERLSIHTPSKHITQSPILEEKGEQAIDAIRKTWEATAQSIRKTFKTTKKVASKRYQINEEKNDRKHSLTIESGLEAADVLQSQQDFENLIAEYHKTIAHYWEEMDRVEALKITIQCSKLLGEGAVAWFYPTKFVLICEVLDGMGNLVYTRLKDAGGVTVEQSGFNITDVKEFGTQIARNWVFKVSCVRELIPRIMIEIAIMSAYHFLPEFDIPTNLKRICSMIRGIGDPIVSIYARAYLVTQTVKMSKIIDPGDWAKELLMQTFDDCMIVLNQYIDGSEDISKMSVKAESLEELIEVVSPAFGWILTNMTTSFTKKDLSMIIEQYSVSCGHAAILHLILEHFPADFVSPNALSFVGLLDEARTEEFSKHYLYKSLGKKFIEQLPPAKMQLQVLNRVWKYVTKLSTPKEYLSVSDVFIQYILECFSLREINIFVKDLIKHMKPNQTNARYQNELSSIFRKIINSKLDILKILQMDNFLPLLDLINDRDLKRLVCKSILLSFQQKKEVITNPVLIYALFDVGSNFHETIDYLLSETELKQAESLIQHFILKVDYGNDLEGQLAFYAECRGTFPNLDGVNKLLVHRAAFIAMTAHHIMKGNHSKKTIAFVKACVAFCHITIASLDDPLDALYLFLLSANVALINGLVGQCESQLKTAIEMIPDLPSNIDQIRFNSWIAEFCSFALLVPGHPELGPFYIINGFLKTLNKCDTWSHNKIESFFHFLSMFSAFGQSKFIYHIRGVDSNDTLFGGHDMYNEKLFILLEYVIETISEMLKEDRSRELLLAFMNALIRTVEMNRQSATFLVKLFRLQRKDRDDTKDDSGYCDNYESRTIGRLKSMKGRYYTGIVEKLV